MQIKKLNPFSGDKSTFSWWWLGIKVGAITALLIWWLLDQQNKKQLQQISGNGALNKNKSIPLPDEDPASVVTREIKSTPVRPDDLRKIEGIGPKIQATLQSTGIETFSQLAAAQPSEIKQILVNAGIRLGDPATWPEQAALAATGNWDELKELQSTLKGGRR